MIRKQPGRNLVVDNTIANLQQLSDLSTENGYRVLRAPDREPEETPTHLHHLPEEIKSSVSMLALE